MFHTEVFKIFTLFVVYVEKKNTNKYNIKMNIIILIIIKNVIIKIGISIILKKKRKPRS